MKKIYIIVLVLLGFMNVQGQESYWSINWDITMTSDETNEFIDEVGYRGLSIEGRYFLKENMSVGGFVAWDNLFDKVTDLPPIEIESNGNKGHISGTQLHYLNVVPILATSHFYLKSNKDLKVFMGVGVGGVYVEQRSDLGLRSFYTDSFEFGVQPEIGVYIPVGYGGSGLNFAVRYLYGTGAGELESLNTLTFAIGFGFMR